MTGPDAKDLLSLIPDPAKEWKYRKALCRGAYQRGYEAAWEAGRRALLEEQARSERYLIDGVLASPDHADLETLRYGPGGRAHYGDRRPGDSPGVLNQERRAAS